jgi:hypothetical protein
MTFRTYLCWATDKAHAFLGNADPERVPHQFSAFVCGDHLPEINKCRRDKGLEELVPEIDSYPRGGAHT